MVKTDYAGLGRIPLDSLGKHVIFTLKYSGLRAIPTLASKFKLLMEEMLGRQKWAPVYEISQSCTNIPLGSH